MMAKLINVGVSTVLAIASLVAAARPPEGLWFPDLALTDSAARTQICNRMKADGFYLFSFLFVLKFEENTLTFRRLGEGPSQAAMLQREDLQTGVLLYNSPTGAPDRLAVQVVPHSQSSLQAIVTGHDNPELNALVWSPKSQEQVTWMEADLMKGNVSFARDIVKVCL